MLVRGKVRHDIERPVRGKQLGKHPVTEIHRIGHELARHPVRARAAQVTHQLGEPVLADVDHDQLGHVKAQQRLDVVRADRARPADDQHAPPVDPRMQFRVITREILRQQTALPPRDPLPNKPLQIEIQVHNILYLSQRRRDHRVF